MSSLVFNIALDKILPDSDVELFGVEMLRLRFPETWDQRARHLESSNGLLLQKIPDQDLEGELPVQHERVGRF